MKWLLSKWPKDSGGNNLEPVGSVRIKLGMAWRKIRKYLYRNDPRELFFYKKNLIAVSPHARLIGDFNIRVHPLRES